MTVSEVRTIFSNCQDLNGERPVSSKFTPSDFTKCFATNMPAKKSITFWTGKYHDYEHYTIYFDTNDIIVGYVYSPGER